MMKRLAGSSILFLFLTVSAWAETYSFGVLPQRSAMLTAQYWNPILDYDMPVAAHPRVPMQVVKAVRDALTGMAADAEGLKILKASAAVIKQEPPWGFVPAQDTEYQNQREVYRIIWKKEAR